MDFHLLGPADLLLSNDTQAEARDNQPNEDRLLKASARAYQPQREYLPVKLLQHLSSTKGDRLRPAAPISPDQALLRQCNKHKEREARNFKHHLLRAQKVRTVLLLPVCPSPRAQNLRVRVRTHLSL
jgi:hypothetical protein